MGVQYLDIASSNLDIALSHLDIALSDPLRSAVVLLLQLNNLSNHLATGNKHRYSLMQVLSVHATYFCTTIIHNGVNMIACTCLQTAGGDREPVEPSSAAGGDRELVEASHRVCCMLQVETGNKWSHHTMCCRWGQGTSGAITPCAAGGDRELVEPSHRVLQVRTGN